MNQRHADLISDRIRRSVGGRAAVAADFTVWRDCLGSPTSLPNDDTPGVGSDDYDRWKENFGQVVGVGSIAYDNAAVPEPSTLMLLTLAVAGRRFRRGRTA